MLKTKAKFSKIFLFALLVLAAKPCGAQKTIKEIAFHLYTDSLKKGTYNYINVDALLENNKWLPMDTSSIGFSSSAGEWYGNNLVIDTSFAQDSIVIKSFLKSSPIMTIQTVMYIKKKKDPQTLPTMEDVLPTDNRRRRKTK